VPCLFQLDEIVTSHSPDHYHIRWSARKPLDWERFTTVQEAVARACELVSHYETYRIEKFGEHCIRCKYPSEQSMREVLLAVMAKGRADLGTFEVLDRMAGGLRTFVQHGFSRRFLAFFAAIEHERSVSARAFASKSSIRVADVMNDPLFGELDGREELLGEKIRSLQVLPLETSANEAIGVITLHYREPQSNSDHTSFDPVFLRDIADHAFAFERTRQP
jgi:hypothetical protein